MRNLRTLGVLFGCLAITIPAMAPAAAAQQNRAGKPTAHAKANVNKPAQRPQGSNASRSGGKKVSNQQAYKAGQASNNRNTKPNRQGNNVVAGNTVVVGQQRPGSSGYYQNGNYYNSDRYDDNDNDFLEFVGKTAAITAGASVVAAVIGSSTNEKPDDCQPVNANGQSYMYCNGTYYQQSGPSSQPTYTVMPPPQ
jgi:hypothetical protein